MTSCGLNPGPLIPSGSYDARIACNLRGKGPSYTYDTYKKADHSMDPYFTQSGEDRESDGDQYVANLRDGAICGFKYFDFSVEKPTRITVTVRGDARGRFLVFGEAECREAIAVIEVSMTDREVWRALTAAFQAPDSVCALFFQYKGEGALDFRAFDLQVS